MHEWLGAAVAVMAQLYFFAIGTTALTVYRLGPGSVPPRVTLLLGTQRFVGGTTSLAGGLFWGSVALLLGVGLIASGFRLGSLPQILAGASSLVLDVVWLLRLRKWVH